MPETIPITKLPTEQPLITIDQYTLSEHTLNYVQHHTRKHAYPHHAPDQQVLLHTIQKGKGQTKLPCFFFHGDWHSHGGPPLYCYVLARTAGPSRPFHTLKPWRSTGARPLPSIQEQAYVYLQHILAIQPEGPYILAGFCNGALLAFECAQQLQRRGHYVKQLTLIDPPALHLRTWLLCHAISAMAKMSVQGHEARHSFYLRTRYLARSLWAHYNPEAILRTHIQSSTRYTPPAIRPDIETLNTEPMANWAALIKDYHWARYRGRLTVLWSTGELDMRRRWSRKRVAHNIESYIIPGNHTSILHSHTQRLADMVCASLP